MDLASRESAPVVAGSVSQFVVFKLGDNEFAVTIQQVQEILALGTLARVPKVPDFIEGIVNVRGKIIPVLNLARRLGLPGRARDQDTRIIVAEVAQQTVGMIVDIVTEVIKFPASAIEPPPLLITTVSPKFVTGVGKLEKRILVILNLDRLLSPEEMAEMTVATGPVASGQDEPAAIVASA